MTSQYAVVNREDIIINKVQEMDNNNVKNLGELNKTVKTSDTNNVKNLAEVKTAIETASTNIVNELKNQTVVLKDILFYLQNRGE